MAAQTANNSTNVDDIFNPFFVTVATGVNTCQNSTDPKSAAWNSRTISANTTWQSVDYGNGVLVAVSSASGTIASSSIDGGTTWVASTMPTTASWYAVKYGGGLWVSVGNNSTIAATSTDGITWTTQTIAGAAKNWQSLAYGNGVFVALANQGTANQLTTAVSSDGVTWNNTTATGITSTGNWTSITYGTYSGSPRFVAVCSGSTAAAYSSDGINWTLSNVLPASTTWTSITYGDSTYVAVSSASTNYCATSGDGITWAQKTIPVSSTWRCVIFGKNILGENVFYACGATTVGYYSLDKGVTWLSKLQVTMTYTAGCYAPFKWFSGDTLTIAFGATVTVSTDQKRFWNTIAGTNGKLLITNDSTSTPIRFGMGRLNTTAAFHNITPASGLFSVVAQGDFIQLNKLGGGTVSDGTANQAFISPYATGDYIPALWVQTGSDINDPYEVWVNVTGSRAWDEFTPMRNGLRGVGAGDGGTCFTQDGNQSAVQYLNLANASMVNNSRTITAVTDTAGLVPGAFITGRGIAATAVVETIIDTHSFTINVPATATLTTTPLIAILPICSQYGTTLRFGDGVNGKIPPNGARIKVPNIMITDYTPANFWNAAWVGGTSAPCYFVGTNGGIFNYNTCLFGESYANYNQANSVTMSNVGLCYTPYVTECYQLSMTNVGYALPPVVQYLSGTGSLSSGATNSNTSITYASSNAVIPGVLITGTNLHACVVSTVTSATTATISVAAYGTGSGYTFTYYGNWTVRDVRPTQSITVGLSSAYSAMQYDYVSNAVFTNVVVAYGGPPYAGGTPGITQANSCFGLRYSNNVTFSSCKIIRVGISQRNRTNENAINLSIEASSIAMDGIKCFNINPIALLNATSSTFTNSSSRHGINNEGYAFANGQRSLFNPVSGAALSTDTKYWYKTRTYWTHDLQETTGYDDSFVSCAAFRNVTETEHAPRWWGVTPFANNFVAPSLAYGNGVWVAIAGSLSGAMVSADNGATWTSAQLPGGVTTWYKVMFVGGSVNLFYVIGGGATSTTAMAVSSDGISWTSVTTAPASARWTAIAYDNGIATNKWAGVAGATTAATTSTYSTDGLTWAAGGTLQTSAQWVDVAASGAGRFVAIAGYNAVGTATAYSTTGNTWVAGGNLASSIWQSIAYGSSRFVAISSSATNGPTAYSTDGTSWTPSTAPTLPTGMSYNQIIFTGSVFVALAGPVQPSFGAPTIASFSQCYATSSDGMSWNALTYLPDFTSWIAMTNNGNAVMFISSGTSRVAYTPNITAGTPTWNIYKDAFALMYNKLAWDQALPTFSTAPATIAAGAISVGSNIVACTSTSMVQVGAILSQTTGIPMTAGLIGAGGIITAGAVVTGVTDATHFTVNKNALFARSAQTPSVVRHAYQIYRSTTENFTERDSTTFIGSTNTTANISLLDMNNLVAGTKYHYRLRKLSGVIAVANCTGNTSTPTTITTSNNFNAVVTSTFCEGQSGKNILITRYQAAADFFSLGLIVGMSVSGTGIPSGTTITAINDFNCLILSANLTQPVTQIGTTVSFGLAPGMYIQGSSVGLDAKIQSVDSNTSMTVTVATTFTFTNVSLNFIYGVEMPEITAIPQMPIVVQNNVIQSTTLATSWTASSITPTSAARTGPCDTLFGANATLTASSLLALAANGTIYQDIQTGVGGTYLVSFFAMAAHPDNRSYITLRVDFGTANQTFTLTRKWTRYSLQFTTTASPTRLTFTIPQEGSLIYVQRVMVTLGTDVPAPTVANGAATTYILTQTNPSGNGLLGWDFESGSGVELNYTAPAGIFWYHIHLSTTSGSAPSYFTPSDANQIYSNEATGADALFYAASATSDITVDNYQPVSNASPCHAIALFSTTGASSRITIKNSKFCFNGALGYLLNNNPGYNIFFHNVDALYQRNNVSAFYADGLVANNQSKGLILQNVRGTFNRHPWASQNLSAIFKGVYGAGAGRTNATTNWNLNTQPTYDGLPIASQAVYDTMFHEMTLRDNRGCLHLMMVASALASKPYTITGGAYFDNSGKLYFRAVGDQVIIEWPHIIHGIIGFKAEVAHIYGADLGTANVDSVVILVEYNLDKGSGYPTSPNDGWKTLSGRPDLISAETGISADGVRIKLRLTARLGVKYTSRSTAFLKDETLWNASSNPTATMIVREIYEESGTAGTIIIDPASVTGTWLTTNTIYSTAGATRSTITATNSNVFMPQPTSYLAGIKIFTSTDTSNLYPSTSVNLNLTSLVSGSTVGIFNDSSALVQSGTSTSTYQYSYGWYGTASSYSYKVRKAGYGEQTASWNLASSDQSIPVFQTQFRAVSDASGYTGIAINGPAKTITVTVNHTILELYDYAQYWSCLTGNIIYQVPLTISVDSNTIYVTSGWVVTVNGATLDDPTRNISGTVNYVSGGVYQDVDEADWEASGDTYYASSFTHTVTDGSDPISSAQLTYFDSTNTNRTYNSSKTLVTSLSTNGSGVASGYAVYKINSTTYSGHYVKVRKYGYLTSSGTRTVNGVAISDSITLTTDNFATDSFGTVSGMTGISLDYSGKVVTVSENHSLSEIYEYIKYSDSLTANMDEVDTISTSDGTNFILTTNWGIDIADGVAVTATGKKLVMSGTGTYNLNSSGQFVGIMADATKTRVPVTLTGLIVGSRCFIEKQSTGTVILNQEAGGSSITTYYELTTDTDVYIRVRKSSIGTKYVPYELSGTITVSGLSVTINQIVDTIAV
jgi:hypothetical protein